jgi:hypothetical protein
MKAHVLVGFRTAQLAGDVVNRIIVHTDARVLQFHVLVGRRLLRPTSHFDIGAGALDPKAWPRDVATFGPRSRPRQVHQFVTGRRASGCWIPFGLHLGRLQ